jgi:protein-S-isoprenylcysteine O-methyltransferase Ste14
MTLTQVIFMVAVVVHMLMLAGAVWSVAVPDRRIWPPSGKRSWGFRLTWAGFLALIFPLNALLLVLDWNSWRFHSPLRFIVGAPLAMLGALLVSWGIATLGFRNTSGLKDGFVAAGPYRFTRNPQYVGDIILFLGLSLCANSLYLWITHALLSLIFVITPLAEEPWLEARYGASYREYKGQAPRFL